MTEAYKLKPIASDESQSFRDESFIGGIPRLPQSESIPQCELCGAEQSFFFQVAFPIGHPWHALSLAVFACTSCADEDHLIPQMLSGPLSNAVIPDGFLRSYQTNFRFMIFKTASASLHDRYEAKVAFRRLVIERTSDPYLDENKIGGNPNWVLGDESPASYGGETPMFFLLQLLQDFRFEVNRGAPPQMELGLDRSPQPSTLGCYHLFNGNKVYLFGTTDPAKPFVYAITQID